MKYFGQGLSEQHKELSSLIRKSSETERSKDRFLQIHAKLNSSVVSDTGRNEVDTLLCDLKQNEYAVMPTSRDETIAWALWHIARIEEFWGKKDVAGMLLMPPARHVMLHLNDCCKWKEAIRTKKR